MQDWNNLTDCEILLEIRVQKKAIRKSKNRTHQMLAENAGNNGIPELYRGKKKLVPEMNLEPAFL